MEKKIELTKDLLCESFIELMEKHPFDKITIRMITDGAGVIRPTFYNYYQDKIELLQYIMEDRLFSSMRILVETGMGKEAFKMLFLKIEDNSKFYRNAFKIKEYDYFKEVFVDNLKQLILLFFDKMNTHDTKDMSIDRVSKYYALGITTIIHDWMINTEYELSGEELFKSYEFVITNSIIDIIEGKPPRHL